MWHCCCLELKKLSRFSAAAAAALAPHAVAAAASTPRPRQSLHPATTLGATINTPQPQPAIQQTIHNTTDSSAHSNPVHKATATASPSTPTHSVRSHGVDVGTTAGPPTITQQTHCLDLPAGCLPPECACLFKEWLHDQVTRPH